MVDHRSPWRARLILVGLFLVFFLPVVGALVMIVVDPGWTPFGTVNRGDLIDPPTPLPGLGSAMPMDGGSPMGQRLRGKWVLLSFAPQACVEACIEALAAQRQARLALGRDADRVERVWLVTDAVPVGTIRQVLADFPGLHAARAVDALIDALPKPGARVIYLIDPTGLVVVRYGGDDLANAILKDLKRLLRISKQG